MNYSNLNTSTSNAYNSIEEAYNAVKEHCKISGESVYQFRVFGNDDGTERIQLLFTKEVITEDLPQNSL